MPCKYLSNTVCSFYVSTHYEIRMSHRPLLSSLPSRDCVTSLPLERLRTASAADFLIALDPTQAGAVSLCNRPHKFSCFDVKNRKADL